MDYKFILLLTFYFVYMYHIFTILNIKIDKLENINSFKTNNPITC